VERPLPCSGQIPCHALLTPARVYCFPRVAPARARCPLETPASKGRPSSARLSSRPQLEVLPLPCKTTQFPAPAAQVQREIRLLAFLLLQKICFRTGCWGCDCYPSDCPKVPDNILPMPRCLLLCWPGGARCLCDCYLAKAELESFRVPGPRDWSFAIKG